jgi:hypothetical protein
MKNIKSYQLFLEDKKVEVSKSVREVIIQFLISQERKSGLNFSNFDLIEDDNGREKFIIAYTQDGPNGEKPPMDKVVFDIIDYYTWGVESRYYKGQYDFDNTWRNPKTKTLEAAINDMKSKILRQIVFDDPSEKLVEPNNDDKKLIDKIIGKNNVWETCKSKVTSIMNSISKYDIEEIEDRLVEYHDELIGWELNIMFAWNHKQSWHGLKSDYDINDQTCRLIWDAFCADISVYEKTGFDEFIKNTKPCIYINFEDKNHKNPKRLSHVEPMGFKIGKRFEQLYDVEEVKYPYYPNTRRFDDESDISDYQMTIILK